MGFFSLLVTSFLDAFAAEFTMCKQEAVEIKFKFIWDPLVKMKICLVPVCFNWHPTHSLCNLKHLHQEI